MPLSRMRCAKLARIIGVLVLAAALAACSAIKLAYNNLPEVSYWWLDGYLDFDDAQTPRVRDELAQLLAWHRQNELPKIVGLLQQAQALAPGDVTPAQACEHGRRDPRAPAGRGRARRAGRRRPRAEPERSAAAAARTQVRQDQRRLPQGLARPQPREAAGEALRRSSSTAARTSTAGSTPRSASCCGSRWRSRRSTRAPSTPSASRRQQEALALLRRFNAEKTAAGRGARGAFMPTCMRIADPPPGPWRDRQQALLRGGLPQLAALHNRTSAASASRPCGGCRPTKAICANSWRRAVNA